MVTPTFITKATQAWRAAACDMQEQPILVEARNQASKHPDIHALATAMKSSPTR